MFAPAEDKKRILEVAKIDEVDAIIPDLEDSTAYTDAAKRNARDIIAEVANESPSRKWDLYPRINDLTSSYWEDDIAALVPHEPEGILIPGAESPELIARLSDRIGELEAEHGIVENSIKLTAMFEHPLGVHRAYEIANCDERMERISLGTEDYTSNLGALRDDEARYDTLRSGIDFARGKIAQEAAAAGKRAIEGSPFTIDNEEYIFKESLKLARMGYEGRAALYPEQVKPILRGFTPSDKEVKRAQKLLEIVEDSSAQETAPIEALERTSEIDSTKISHSIVGQARLVLKRYEAIGSRSEM